MSHNKSNQKIYLFITAIVLLLSMFFGFIIAMPPTYSFQEIDNTYLYFITKNVPAIFILLAGAVTFGSTTFLCLRYNGLHLGIMLRKSMLSGLTVKEILLLTLPHGIFEIPAIIIAGAAGFKIPYEIIRYLAGKKEQPLTKEDIKEYFMLALISIILIVIAAFVEAYITPKVAEHFLSNLY